MAARLERIARMKPDDRFDAVLSFIEGAASRGDIRPVMRVTYRAGRHAEPETRMLIVAGVASNDNGTSFGELIVQNTTHRLYGISLAHVDALETIDPPSPPRAKNRPATVTRLEIVQ